MLSDWSSVFQLACAYTLILGGYTNIKSKNERDAEEMLDRAQAKLALLIRCSLDSEQDTGQHEKVEVFEYLDWKTLSLRQLNKHRRKLTTWYYDEKDRRRRLDVYRNAVLICTGLIAFSLLIMSAAFSELKITRYAGLAISAALWTPTFGIMGWTWFEDFKVGQQIRRTKAPEPGKEPKPSKKPFRGMIYAVTNHIERISRTRPDLHMTGRREGNRFGYG